MVYKAFTSKFLPGPSASMIEKQIGRDNFVGMGAARVVLVGKEATLSSGTLTLCSAATAKLHYRGEYLANVFVHQGFNDPHELRLKMFEEIKSKIGDFEPKEIELKDPIVHTAPDTKYGGDDDMLNSRDSLYDLCNALDNKIPISELLKIRKSPAFYDGILNVEIDEDGHVRSVESFDK